MNLVNELRAWAGSLEETRASVARQIEVPDYVGEVGQQAQLLNSAIAAVEEWERCQVQLAEAEAALWRIPPNCFSVVDNPKWPGDEDPFEGPGETYRAAYERVSEELNRVKAAVQAAKGARDE